MGRRLVSSIRGNNVLGTMTVESSTFTSLLPNSNIIITPDGTGDVLLNADTVRVGDQDTTATITSNGLGNMVINTNSGTNSGSITIAQGVNGNITIEPNGTGDVFLNADTVRVGDVNATATITSNGTGDMVINTNSGANSGFITIAQGVNGNITIEPNGTGDVLINADTLQVGDANAAATITTNGTGNLTINTNSGTNSGSLTITQGVNGNISLLGNGTSTVTIGQATNSVNLTGTITESIPDNTATAYRLTEGANLYITAVTTNGSETVTFGTTPRVLVTNNTASSSTSSGALVVSGGTGIAGALYAGGIVRFTDSTASSSTSTGAMVVSGGVGVAGNLNVGGTISGTITGVITYNIRTGSVTLPSSDTHNLTIGGGFTLQLPTSPANGTVIKIADGSRTWGTSNITVARGGSNTIAGVASNLVLNVTGVEVTLVFFSGDWKYFT